MTLSSIEAYDDGYFPYYYKGGRGFTYIAGVHTYGPSRVVKIAWSPVKVDGNTSTSVILELTKILEGEMIILDGITYAGFDVVDPDLLTSSTGKKTVVVIQYPLNLDKIEYALRKHFLDWKDKFAIIKRVYESSVHVETPWKTIRIYTAGMKIEDAINIVRRLCIYSPVPEPLRLADKIATALSRFKINVRP